MRYGVRFMGCIDNGNITICGNFTKARRYKNMRPKNWDRDYKAIVLFNFKWRDKKCGIECNCKEVIEAYQPWYGFSYYHSDECAIIQYYKKHPQRFNFLGGSPRCFAQSE